MAVPSALCPRLIGIHRFANTFTCCRHERAVCPTCSCLIWFPCTYIYFGGTQCMIPSSVGLYKLFLYCTLLLPVHVCLYVLSLLLRFLAFPAWSAEGSRQRENTAILQYEIGMCTIPYNCMPCNYILTHAYTYLQISLVVAVPIVLSLLSLSLLLLSLLPLPLLSEGWGLMCGFSVSFMTFGNEETSFHFLCYIISV